MSDLAFVLAFLAALGCALAAGVFFAFSTFVMSGLGRAAPATAVAAMQGINRAAPGPPLMAVLFGSAALCVGVAVLALVGDAGAGGGYAVAGAPSAASPPRRAWSPPSRAEAPPAATVPVRIS